MNGKVLTMVLTIVIACFSFLIIQHSNLSLNELSVSTIIDEIKSQYPVLGIITEEFKEQWLVSQSVL